MAGDGRLILTGQLGDVMKESAPGCLSLVKSRAETLGIDPISSRKRLAYSYTGRGAIPKDGPSAGSRSLSRWFHLLTRRRISKDVAMTVRSVCAVWCSGRRHQRENARQESRDFHGSAA